VCHLIKAVDPALPTSIKFVRQYKARKVVYDVEMFNPYDAQSIRDAFGLFWRKKSGKRLPEALKGISFSNVTTFSTRVRLRLLKEVCRHHQAANPTLSCFVTSYMPRPDLKIRDKKGPLTSLTYTEAVVSLSHHLTTEFLVELSQFARTNLSEKQIAERFLVLSPDYLGSVSPSPAGQAAPMVAPPAAGAWPTPAPSAGQVASMDVTPSSSSFQHFPPFANSYAFPASTEQTISQAPLLALSPPEPTLQPLTNVSVSPTVNLSLPSLLASSQSASSETWTETNEAQKQPDLDKRNRGKFAKKSTPYPLPT
jgi:hypothetical protein